MVQLLLQLQRMQNSALPDSCCTILVLSPTTNPKVYPGIPHRGMRHLQLLFLDQTAIDLSGWRLVLSASISLSIASGGRMVDGAPESEYFRSMKRSSSSRNSHSILECLWRSSKSSADGSGRKASQVLMRRQRWQPAAIEVWNDCRLG